MLTALSSQSSGSSVRFGLGLVRTTKTNPGASSVQVGYNLESMLTTATNELSQTTTVAYDSAGRTTSVTNARGDIESYSYNSNGWRTGVTNGRNYTRTYTRSSRGEVTALSMPDSTTEGWAFGSRLVDSFPPQPEGPIAVQLSDNAVAGTRARQAVVTPMVLPGTRQFATCIWPRLVL